MSDTTGFIILDSVAIDRNVFSQRFTCKLSACAGACCVEGEAGAPLTAEEAHLLAERQADIIPFLNAKGREALQKQGASVRGLDGGWETPLVNGRECAYAFFEGGVARCGVEEAHVQGEIDFQKPISCHLYPIRIYEREPFQYMLYEEWDICAPACKEGEKSNLSAFEFVRDALIRRFGEDFYERMLQLSRELP